MVRPLVSDRARPSVEAIQRTLAREIEMGRAGPVPLEEVAALHDAFTGQRPWVPTLLEPLLALAHFTSKPPSGGEPPAGRGFNMGDAVSALMAMTPPAGEATPALSTATQRRPAPAFAGEVDVATFAKLGFSDTSAGIAHARRKNREGWWAHARRNRAFIEEAAQAATRKRLAVVLGAGQANDLPLVELATLFDHLVLVDIDGRALEATASRLFEDEALRRRVELRVVDLSGINHWFIAALDDVLATPGSREQVDEALARLCRSYRPAEGPVWLAPDAPDERADLVVSSLLLTQLAWPQRAYALRLYQQRFGAITHEAERRWRAPWWELELKIQQDHLNALPSSADTAVLTSDVVDHRTKLDPAGREIPTGEILFPLGVPSLPDRIPRFLAVERHASWPWNRDRPTTRGASGSRMDVEAVVLREPRSPIPRP